MHVGGSVTGVSGRIKGEPSQVGRHKDVWLKSSTAFAYHLCSLLVSASAMLLSLPPSFTDSGVSFSKGLQLSRNPQTFSAKLGLLKRPAMRTGQGLSFSRVQAVTAEVLSAHDASQCHKSPLGYILTLLVLFLWRTPTNRVCMVCGGRSLTKYKKG